MVVSDRLISLPATPNRKKVDISTPSSGPANSMAVQASASLEHCRKSNYSIIGFYADGSGGDRGFFAILP